MPCTVRASHAAWAEDSGKEGKPGLQHTTALLELFPCRVSPFFLHVPLKSPVAHTAKML